MMHLNQYYTEDRYGDILVNNLSSISPKVALDLGFGTGNLLNAARRRWSELNLIGVDLDHGNVNRANFNSKIVAFEHNGFDPSLPDIIKDRYGDIDLLVGNPPYFSREFDTDAKKILASIGMLDCIPATAKKIPAELIFIAQNLRLLSSTGELGLIVPAGLVSGEKWKPFREFLFSEYSVPNVIQLPTNSFKNTEAQTFILTVKQKSLPKTDISISHINTLMKMKISTSQASNRADYNFYRTQPDNKELITIKANDFILLRGNRSKNNLQGNQLEFIHTTDLPPKPTTRTFNHCPIDGQINMKSEDILIARVGRRCLGRTMHIKSGSLPVSDCIIILRPKTSELGKKIWEKLSHPDSIKYFSDVSLGVGAKYITYKTITDYLVKGSDATTGKL